MPTWSGLAGGRMRKIGRPLALVWVMAVVLASLAACSSGASPAPASSSGSASISAYFNCLSRNARPGARKKCKPLRPTSGLGPALQEFTNCLESRGATVPSPAPGAKAGSIMSALLPLANGTSAQRSAFSYCESQMGV